VLGEAFLFRIIAYISAIVLALVVAYATGGFWIRLKPFNTQATVTYTGDALLIVEVSST
jgi:transmembrane protein 231